MCPAPEPAPEDGRVPALHRLLEVGPRQPVDLDDDQAGSRVVRHPRSAPTDLADDVAVEGVLVVDREQPREHGVQRPEPEGGEDGGDPAGDAHAGNDAVGEHENQRVEPDGEEAERQQRDGHREEEQHGAHEGV